MICRWSTAWLLLTRRRLLQLQLDLDIGWHGSSQGKAYAKAFLDYLKGMSEGELIQHLDRHYTAKTDTGDACFMNPDVLPPTQPLFTFSGGIDFCPRLEYLQRSIAAAWD